MILVVYLYGFLTDTRHSIDQKYLIANFGFAVSYLFRQYSEGTIQLSSAYSWRDRARERALRAGYSLFGTFLSVE